MALLGRVGYALVHWGETGEQRVAFVLLGLPEFSVGAVEPIQHSEDPETLVEPEVVEVVELGGGEEGEVVSTVGDGGADQSQAVPHAGGGQVGAQDHRPQCHRPNVGDHVLQRMSVYAYESNGSGPLVVLFVETLVEDGMVEQPVRIVENDFLRDGEESQLHQGPVEGGQLRATGLPFPGHQVESHHHHGPRDEHVVEDDSLHRMDKLYSVHRVILAHLDAVASDEGGFTGGVHQRQQSIGPPEHQRGDQHRPQVEQSSVMTLKRHVQLGPQVLPEIS